MPGTELAYGATSFCDSLRRSTPPCRHQHIQIPWSSPAVSMSVKKETFFRAIEDLIGRIEVRQSALFSTRHAVQTPCPVPGT
eukprot:1366130-Rhodomonas_salina.6